MTTKPYKYQREGVELLRKFDGRALLADDMGLGKTLQVLLYIKKHLKEKGPILVICPATAKYTWEEQALEHVGMRVVLLNGRKPDAQTVRGMQRRDQVIYVISYNCLTGWINHLVEMKPVLIVPDEAQRLKNPFAQWTKAAMRLTAPHVIPTGGTGGIEKLPSDLWPVLVMLRSENWPKKWKDLARLPVADNYPRFVQKYTKRVKTRFGWRSVGPKNLKTLNKFLKKHLLIRRRTKDVLKDLPPKQRFKVYVDLTSRRKYDLAQKKAENEMWKLSRDFGGGNEIKVKAVAARLLKKTSKLKVKAVKEWIDDFLENSPGEKLIVFGWNKFMVRDLQKKYPNSVLVDGGVTGRKRQAAIDRFNNEPSCILLFGNLRAAGEAWSCKSASTACFVQLYPNPAVHNQAEKRVHGVGRGVKGRPARYFYLIAKDTAEERLLAKIRKEQKMIDEAIDAGRSGGGIDLFEVVTGGKR